MFLRVSPNFHTHFRPIYRPVGQPGPNLTWFSKIHASKLPVFFGAFSINIKQVTVSYVRVRHHPPLKFHPKVLCCWIFLGDSVLSNVSEYILFLYSDGQLWCNFTFCDFTFKYLDHFPQPWKSTLVKTHVSYPVECKMSQEWLKWCSETTTTTTTPKLDFIILLNVKCPKNGWSDVQRQPQPPQPPLNSIWLCRLRKFSCQTLGWWWGWL